ncbi:hypothetical protein N0V93_005401 [Gnomoniopsis smithogilvyi]|uniref:Uncharacterized protein n=1 Tax=Gnomoniopsis smithogilvyi TaxID=1191159 RepID=A0A9W8YST6_9PEZI|nr:hypothetical protein N0V93_005401 [Gnomoniopsis smithogilvyi]
MGAPVILCGATERIGSGVIENLKPEYDVIHFVMSVEAARVQIKAIFEGNQSPPSDSELGSKVYSQKPIAVILGGAFTDEDVTAMMKATAHIHPIPWLRPDKSKPTPPLGPAYGKAMVDRIKERIPQLEQGGEMGEAKQFLF